jgi:hypothetical protein
MYLPLNANFHEESLSSSDTMTYHITLIFSLLLLVWKENERGRGWVSVESGIGEMWKEGSRLS